MFGKKKKQEEVWELEDIYAEAKKRLLDMERDPNNFTISSKEEDLIDGIEFNRNRLQAATDEKERSMLKALLETYKTELEAIKRVNPIVAQRQWVADLAKQKEEWTQSRKVKPLSKDAKLAATVTIGVAVAGAVVERLGHIVSWSRVHLPLPRHWKE